MQDQLEPQKAVGLFSKPVYCIYMCSFFRMINMQNSDFIEDFSLNIGANCSFY